MRALPVILVLATIVHAADASAQSKGKVAAEIRQTQSLVLENIDLGDYVGARDQLLEAKTKAEKAELAGEMVNAKTHAMLAAVYVLGFRDEATAIEHFKVVLGIAPGYELEAPLNGEPVKQAMAKADAILNPVITCESLRGLDHKQVLTAKEGEPVKIAFKAGPKLLGGTAHVHYRAPTARKYLELDLQLTDKCDYVGEIPAEAVDGILLYYFVSMRKKDDGRFTAMRGNAKSPYPIQIERTVAKVPAAEAKTRNEVPDELDFGGNNKPKGGGCAGCTTGGEGGPALPASLLLLVVGALTLRRRHS